MFDYIFQIGLLSHVNIEEHPNVTILRKSSEDWSLFVKVMLISFLFFPAPRLNKNTTLLHYNMYSLHTKSLAKIKHLDL